MLFLSPGRPATIVSPLTTQHIVDCCERCAPSSATPAALPYTLRLGILRWGLPRAIDSLVTDTFGACGHKCQPRCSLGALRVPDSLSHGQPIVLGKQRRSVPCRSSIGCQCFSYIISCQATGSFLLLFFYLIALRRFPSTRSVSLPLVCRVFWRECLNDTK